MKENYEKKNDEYMDMEEKGKLKRLRIYEEMDLKVFWLM